MNQEFSNKNQVVFITGSSHGIGEELAYKFSRAGYAVVIAYHRDLSAGESVVAKCLQSGATDALLVQLDVTDQKSITCAIERIISRFRKIDVLVNNAGVVVKKYFRELNYQEIEQQISTNLIGTIYITKTALPYVTKSIVTVGSSAGLCGLKKFSVYSATKFALRGFTQALAKELPHLRVYTVNPKATATRMSHFKGTSPKKVARIIFSASIGNYTACSGSDINVWEYEYGELLKYLIRIIRGFKRSLRG